MSKLVGMKLLAIGVLTLVIWIALLTVSGVIDDRQKYRDDSLHAIEASYAGPQTLIGPVLVRPYTQTVDTVETNDKGVKRTVSRTSALMATSFPRDLKVAGRMVPSEKRHGLYKVTVYELQGELTGAMEVIDPKTEGKVVWGEPYLALSVTDVRGIVGTPKATINGVEETMVQGAPAATGWQPNLRVPLRGAAAAGGHMTFDLAVDLAGTERLGIAPVGDSNHVEMQSTWPSPLFAAQFLPRAKEMGAEGFKATWDVSSLASGTQVQMMDAQGKGIDLMEVSLLTPIDPYKLSDRATKYGILFVVLTFGGFFLFEMMKHLPIHPVQYLLVGFGLAVFFLLLISFSEHMAFGLAYVLASAACIGLLTFYLSFVLRSMTRGLGFGVMLTTLYSAVYGLLISEDNALILGSLMLFAVLALVMVVTRRIDWYKGGAELLAAKESYTSPMPPPPVGLGLS